MKSIDMPEPRVRPTSFTGIGWTPRVRVLPVVLALIIVVAADTAQACSCLRAKPVSEQFSAAGAVFVGRVERVGDRFHVLQKIRVYLAMAFGRDPFEQYERCCGYEIRFTVDRMWRGPGHRTITVLTGRGGGDCGYEFERGRRYLVYAYPSGNEWSTNICTRTQALDEKSEDLAYLNQLPEVVLKR